MAKLAPISVSVDQGIDLWLGARASYGRSLRTIEQYRHATRRFAIFLAEQSPERVSLDDIDTAVLRRYAVWLATSPVASSVGQKRANGATLGAQTVASYMRAVVNLFNWSAENDLLNGPNPVSARGLIPPVPRNPKRAPMTNEVQRMLAAVERPDPEFKGQRRLISAMNARSRALLWVMVDTGMRVSEIANLDLSDYDRGQSFLHIRDSKGGDSRFVFITSEACSALDLWIYKPREQLLRRRAPTGFDHRYFDALAEADPRPYPGTRPGPLFVDRRGGRMTAHGIRIWLRHLCERAGVPIYRPHDLRRFYITQAGGGGMPLPQLMAQVGHAKAQTTMGYMVQDMELHRQSALNASPLKRMRSGPTGRPRT